MRSGLIVKKVGMTRLYLEDGTHVPVTVLSLKDCQVIANQSLDKNGYNSITLATGEAKPKNTNKSQREAFAKIKVTPKQKQMEFRVSEDNMLPIGSELGANHFVVGQYVDATGITIGKGFAGAMKRHILEALELHMEYLFLIEVMVLQVIVKIQEECLKARKWQVKWEIGKELFKTYKW